MPTKAPNRLFYVRKRPERAPLKRRELAIQRALVSTLRNEFPLVEDFFNDWAAGAYLTPGQYRSRKELSSGRGWSDLFIPYPSRGYHGLFLEIKKEGTRIYRRDKQLVADEQIRTEAAFLKRQNDRGYFARFGVGMDGCVRILRWYFGKDDRSNTELF